MARIFQTLNVVPQRHCAGDFSLKRTMDVRQPLKLPRRRNQDDIEIRDFRTTHGHEGGQRPLGARAFYSCGFPFAAIDNKAFRHAVGETAKLGRFYPPPSNGTSYSKKE